MDQGAGGIAGADGVAAGGGGSLWEGQDVLGADFDVVRDLRDAG